MPEERQLLREHEELLTRWAVGYRRYDTPETLEGLHERYASLRLSTDYFQPSMKLIEKTQRGSKVRKTCDKEKTPANGRWTAMRCPKRLQRR